MKMKLIILCLFIPVTQLFSQRIPIEILPSGHILVKAQIENKEGTFIFDTGGGLNVFSKSFAKDFTTDTSYHFLTAYRATGERMDVPLYENQKILFAGKTFSHIPYSTFDLDMGGIDGIISLQMFGETDFIIDYTKKEIILTDLSKGTSSKSFDIQLSTYADKSTDIFTYILLNGKIKIQVLLDSGAGNNSFWISDKFIDPLGIEKNSLEESEMKSEFDEKITNKYYRGKIQSISNQYATLENPKIRFVEGLIYEGKTSINCLGKKLALA